MKTTYKFISIFSLIAILALAFATPAQAFDDRAGDNIEIKAGEVIEDDVYITANNFILEGTVKGDLVIFGQTITINGTVEGDLIAAGQSIIINGTVTDDARIAGALLEISKSAVIGGDVVAAGASLETQDGSVVEGDLVVGAGQTLLAGNINGDVKAGAGALELSGEIGGNVNAQVGDPEAGGPTPSMYMPQSDLTFPTVKPGFTVAEGAKIKGNLEYTQSKEINFPANAVSGKIIRTEPVVDPAKQKVETTPAQAAMDWAFALIRSIITLVIFGLLLGWLAPMFIKALMEKTQSQPAAALGWGLVAYATFFFAILVVIVAIIAGGIFFGALTLGKLSGTIAWVGLLTLFAMTTGFALITAFLTKIVVAWLGGKLILTRVKPELAEHKFLPLIIGVIIVSLLVAIPYIGWLFGLIIMFIGLGALWIWGRDLWQARKTVAA
jgi:cytoskeletal protein CcmA (bactofilin family)